MKIRTVRLVAKSRQTYGTRRLQAGDVFAVRRNEAAVLIAMGRADRPPAESEAAPARPRPRPAPVAPRPAPVAVAAAPAPAPVEPPPAPAPVAAMTTEQTELEMLQAAYVKITGRKPHPRWTAVKLRAELSKRQ